MGLLIALRSLLVSAAIFLVAGIAMMFAVGGRPGIATGLFAIGSVAAVARLPAGYRLLWHLGR